MKQPHPRKLSRRTFVKSTAAGALSMGVAPLIFIPRFTDLADGGFTYHPNFDPLRVVGIHDPRMTKEENPTAPWAVQDRLVDHEVTERNMDHLACTLSEEKRPEDAWKKIFIKPPNKSWKETMVAIKTNNIAVQHTRSAVMAKICRVFTQVLGVKAEHIAIYDGCHGRDMKKKTPFTDLPKGCRVESTWGGFKAESTVGRPWKDEGKEVLCVKPLADGEVDILVNIALCKGHSSSYGGFSMSMKNHLGTYYPKHAHADEGRTEYVLAVNKTPVILGGLDMKKKKLLFPRQQLCIVDALWCSEQGPMDPSSDQANRIFMSTCSPALDYQVAHRFRKETMKWRINEPVVDRFMTEFGLSPSDFKEPGIIDASKKV